MGRYATVPLGGALGEALSAGSYEAFRKSNLPLVLLVLNIIGALAHGTGITLVRVLARQNIELNIWHHTLVNTGNMSYPEWERNQEVTTINPTTVITFFFGLSLTFHVVISLFLLAHQFYPDAWWNQWYVWGIYHNLAIWRWLEYVFSAPLMLLLAAPMMGVREIHSIMAVVGSLGVTILFGWLTELHATYFIEPAPEPYKFCGWTLVRQWKPGSWKTRFQFHLLGYFPYALCWIIVFDRFRLNLLAVSDIVPDFVNATVIGSFALFTFFGITQLLHQLLPYGPSLYWLGEIIYVVLSFAAKAELGLIVLFQALVDGGSYDNVLEIKVASA